MNAQNPAMQELGSLPGSGAQQSASLVQRSSSGLVSEDLLRRKELDYVVDGALSTDGNDYYINVRLLDLTHYASPVWSDRFALPVGELHRLDEVVTAYLKEERAGRTPEPEAWLARYPALAADLAEFLADRAAMERLAGPLRSVAPAALPASRPPTIFTAAQSGV